MDAAPLIWLNGFPGSGKLTIAKALAALHHNVIVLDNHKLIDPVEISFSRDHPDYQRQRKLVRETTFDNHVLDSATRSRMVIFTDFQSSNDLGRSVANEYKNAASRAGRPFVPVYIECDLEDNIARLRSSARLSSGTGKLLDVDILKTLRSRCKLYKFDSAHSITIDSTRLPPSDAASTINTFVGQLSQKRSSADERSCMK